MTVDRLSVRSAALLGCGLLLSACTEPAPPATETAALRRVQVARVETGPVQPAVRLVGVSASRDTATLAFKIGGVIATIGVREGETVAAGQVLARLEVAEIDAQLTQAEEAQRKAQRDLARGQQLFDEDVVTREQLDDLATAEAVARAQLDAVRYNRGYAELVAPAAGRVLRRLADPRTLVQAGQPVLELSRSQSGMVLRGGVADRDAVRVRTGDPAEVRFDALPGQRFAATVAEISAAADPASGTYRVELALAPPEPGTGPDAGALASGLIGSARILPRETGTRSYLPLAALVEGDQRASRIYLLEADNTVREALVAIAFLDGERAALEQPLPADARVVTAGAAYLRDGERVQVQE